MGKIDIAANAYVSENDVFADAFNFLFFNGQEVVAASRLRPLDTSVVLFSNNAAPDDSHKGKRKTGVRNMGSFSMGSTKKIV